MASFKLFGFSFGRDREDEISSPIKAETDATINIDNAPGFINPYVNSMSLDQVAQTENEYIGKYRDCSTVPEVQQCIEEITSEAIIADTDELFVKPNLDKLEFSEAIKEKIQDSFNDVYNLLLFSRKGHDIFRRWYIDGRLNYQVMIDNDDPKAGIQGLRFIDPRKIKKVREAMKSKDPNTGITTVTGYREYYIYNEQGIGNRSSAATGSAEMGRNLANIGQSSGDVVIAPDTIVHVPSGCTDANTGFTVSYLHNVLRTANNLRMMEDSMLIYRLVRAPERRVFYIDTGNLPKAKAAQYVQEIADKNRTKIIYDVGTGEIKNDRRYMAMTEDYWIPRKEGSRGTEIETLPGGEQIGETAEPEYFKSKLYAAMNVPAGRFSSQPSLFDSGSQVTRDEVRFSRFINQLRTKFSYLFEELLGHQLILTGVMTKDEWDDVKSKIDYEYAEDSHFAEAIATQTLQTRVSILAEIDPFVGKYVSREFVYKKVLMMSDEEMADEIKKIAKEPPLVDPNAPADQPAPQQTQTEDVDQDAINELVESELQLNQTLTRFLEGSSE